MNPQQQQPQGQNVPGAIGLVLFLARSVACTVEVFLHEPGTFGRRYLGLQAVAGVGILVIYPVFWVPQDTTLVMVFLCAYLGMCGVVRIASMKRSLQGGQEGHSFYSGRPRPFRKGRPLVSEKAAKTVMEPLAVLVAGALIFETDEPFGTYLIVASVCLMLSAGAVYTWERARVMEMHDVFIEQQSIAEQFRRMQDR